MVLLRGIFGIIAFAGFIQCDLLADEENGSSDSLSRSDADIVSSVMYAPVPTNRIAAVEKPPAAEYVAASGEEKVLCKNYRTDFSRDVRDWVVENSMQDTYDIDSNGLQFNLLPPKQYIRLLDPNNMPYNQIGGRGPTLNSTYYMRYGKVSANIRSAGTGGAVTAFILMADGGDEIDFEILGGDSRHVQSNYFWGKTVEYTVNGGLHPITGGDIDKTFHKYTVDWTPEKIDWLVDGLVVRTRLRADTCDASGQCKFPSQPARIQFGLWDGSIESGTAEWSRGPIDWSLPHTISANVRDIQVDCHPDYNQIVN